MLFDNSCQNKFPDHSLQQSVCCSNRLVQSPFSAQPKLLINRNKPYKIDKLIAMNEDKKGKDYGGQNRQESRSTTAANPFTENLGRNNEPMSTTTTTQTGNIRGVDFVYRHTETVPLHQHVPSIAPNDPGYVAETPGYHLPAQVLRDDPNAAFPDLDLIPGSNSNGPPPSRGIIGNFMTTLTQLPSYLSAVTSTGRTQPSSDRHTVLIHTTYKDHKNRDVTDTQEMEFGSLKSAQEYVTHFAAGHPDLVYTAKIRGPGVNPELSPRDHTQ